MPRFPDTADSLTARDIRSGPPPAPNGSMDGDPSSNISDIENVKIIFKDGIGYDSQKLIQSVRGLVGLR